MNKHILIIIYATILMISTLQSVNAQSAINRYDIVISEIMADPTPAIELPDAEYIELYNRTSIPQSLHGWKLTLGATTKNLPDIQLSAHGYAVIIDEKNLSAMAPFSDSLYTLS
ncbi:MAG: lamin tail domain-containing protein, partial [Bacteroidales bacterium]|nr:lamin tail domain-containing protein [Bacteroidales bacterium]